jgi:hypothetical protein
MSCFSSLVIITKPLPNNILFILKWLKKSNVISRAFYYIHIHIHYQITIITNTSTNNKKTFYNTRQNIPIYTHKNRGNVGNLVIRGYCYQKCFGNENWKLPITKVIR